MGNVNKVFLMGRLTRDPERRVLPTGAAVVDTGLAVNRRYTDREGQRKEETLFMDISLFGTRGEAFQKYLSKGDPVFIEGRLRLSRWNDPDGKPRSKIRVVVEDWEFCEKKGRNGNDAGGERWESEARPERYGATPDEEHAPEEDRAPEEPVESGVPF
ncbi:MAG: single-stranded DNA-binding protein [Planctomycetes bacterium]|nr:single-stranded DNA-binding protein [Planctomycetota bacterium]